MASLSCRNANYLRAFRSLGARRSAAASRVSPVFSLSHASPSYSASSRGIRLLSAAPPPLSRLSNQSESSASASPAEQLPSFVEAYETESPILGRLSAEQQKIVMHTLGPVLVLAGPGTGKTHTIAARVARLVRSGVPASHIVGALRTCMTRVCLICLQDLTCSPPFTWLPISRATSSHLFRAIGGHHASSRRRECAARTERHYHSHVSRVRVGFTQAIRRRHSAFACVDVVSNFS